MREPRPGWWLAGLLLAALLLPTRVSIPVVALVLLLVGGTRWWVGRTARRLQGSCSVPERANYEQHAEAVLEVRNGSRLPAPWVELDFPTAFGLGRTEPYREALMLHPLGGVTRRVPLRCVRRGRHTVGPPRLRIGDVFGVFEAHADLGQPATITVFPQIVPLERLGLPAPSPFVAVPNQRSLQVDPTAVVGTRAYRAGDPLSAIHWTATARTQQLMVKQYERAEARETLVCLDLSTQGYPRGGVQSAVELAITVAASVLHHSVVAQRLPAGLLAAVWSRGTTQPVSFPARADQAHLRQMLEVLAVAQHGATTPLAELLANLTRLTPGTTVLAITGQLDPETAANLIRLTHEGVPAGVALTAPSADDDALTIQDLWLPVYRITDTTTLPSLAA